MACLPLLSQPLPLFFLSVFLPLPLSPSLPPFHSEVYSQLVSQGLILPQPEVAPPTVPMDYKWAQELGLIRKPAAFLSSICDERGEELLYAGMPISDVFKDDIGIGGVLSLLWFQRRYAISERLSFKRNHSCEILIVYYSEGRAIIGLQHEYSG